MMSIALRTARRLATAVLLLSALAAPFAAHAAQATLYGAASYRERLALPADAVFEAMLIERAQPGEKANVIGRTRVESPGTPPIRFQIVYDPIKLTAGAQYAVRARIVSGGRVLFASDEAAPVFQDPIEFSDSSNPKPLKVELHRAQDGQTQSAE